MAALPIVAFFVRIFALSCDSMPENHSNQNPDKKQITLSKTLAFTIEFGFIIVIPLLIFGFGGKWLSTRYNNPIFLYAGLLLALFISTAWFYKIIRNIYKDFLE
jgi:hypothetical protein